VQAALAELAELAPFYKFLGSYPQCEPGQREPGS